MLTNQSKGKKRWQEPAAWLRPPGRHGPKPEWVQPLTCCQQEEEMENAEQFTPISLHHVSNLDKRTGEDGDHRTNWAGLTHTHTSASLRLWPPSAVSCPERDQLEPPARDQTLLTTDLAVNALFLSPPPSSLLASVSSAGHHGANPGQHCFYLSPQRALDKPGSATRTHSESWVRVLIDLPIRQLVNLLYLFIWLYQMLVATHRNFYLSWSLWDLFLQLQHAGSLVVAWELLVVHVGSRPLIRDQTQAPVLGAWSLSHWTTREVPLVNCFISQFSHL